MTNTLHMQVLMELPHHVVLAVLRAASKVHRTFKALLLHRQLELLPEKLHEAAVHAAVLDDSCKKHAEVDYRGFTAASGRLLWRHLAHITSLSFLYSRDI